jgi:ATP/maltotriose-dependent transcriptional regulator MalT
MSRRPIADRKPEIELFCEMLAGKTHARILLVQAASGLGKSDLLRRFAHECPDDICLVRLDLRGTEKGIAEVFSVFRQELGADALPRFAAAYARLAGVNISDITTIAGKLDISVVLNVDEQTRKFNLEKLEDAFFQDLRAACRKIAVIFDTFEQAPPDLQNWLGGVFLRYAARIPHLCVVIAGQRVPERTIEKWEDVCERRILREIDDVNEWHEFVREVQLPFDRSAVQAIVLAYQGNPRNIQLCFDAIAPRWRT